MLVMMFILDREPTSQLATKDPPMPIFFNVTLKPSSLSFCHLIAAAIVFTFHSYSNFTLMTKSIYQRRKIGTRENINSKN